MGFTNTSGWEANQAVALQVASDKSAFHNCKIDGYQDTLFYENFRSFFHNCAISGTVDFIFGYGSAVFQNCELMVKRSGPGKYNFVTADGGLDLKSYSGLVLQNCKIFPEPALFPERLKIETYLSRPWKDYSRTVVMESEIGDLIRPEGWIEFKIRSTYQTCFISKYMNRGSGADTSKRIYWKGYHRSNDKKQILAFTVGQFLEGGKRIGKTGAPHYLGLAQ